MRFLRVCFLLSATVLALSAVGCGADKNEDLTTPTAANPNATPGMENARGASLKAGRTQAGNVAAQPDGGK